MKPGDIVVGNHMAYKYCITGIDSIGIVIDYTSDEERINLLCLHSKRDGFICKIFNVDKICFEKAEQKHIRYLKGEYKNIEEYIEISKIYHLDIESVCFNQNIIIGCVNIVEFRKFLLGELSKEKLVQILDRKYIIY